MYGMCSDKAPGMPRSDQSERLVESTAFVIRRMPLWPILYSVTENRFLAKVIVNAKTYTFQISLLLSIEIRERTHMFSSEYNDQTLGPLIRYI